MEFFVFMPTISLPSGHEAIVDQDDYDKLSLHKWFVKGKNDLYPMRKQAITRKHIFMHRVIMQAPDGMEVDHINGDTLDNRKSNLRICSHSENMRNKKTPNTNTSGYKGVSWYAPMNKWQAKIGYNGARQHIGYFDTAEEAAAAYNQIAEELFGAFTR